MMRHGQRVGERILYSAEAQIQYNISEYFPVEASTTYGWKRFGNTNANAPAICFYDSEKNYISDSGMKYAQRANFTVTTPSNAAYARLSIFASSTGSKCIFVNGSTLPDSWTPYSNICPISGWDEAVVTRTGKNLLDKSQEVKSWFISSDKVTNSANGKSVICPCKPNKTYTISKLAGQRFAVGYTKTTPAVGVDVYGTITNNSGNSITITTGDNAVYLFIYFYNGSYDTVTEAEILNSLQVELGTSVSTYEPYRGTSVTISLDGTRYGGVIDVLTGEMTVTHGDVDLCEYDWLTQSIDGNTAQ